MLELFLFKISQNVNNDYDTYDSAVVVAENHREAQDIHPNGRSTWDNDVWVDPDYQDRTFHVNDWADPKHVKILKIGIVVPSSFLKKGAVVVSSYNAG